MAGMGNTSKPLGGSQLEARGRSRETSMFFFRNSALYGTGVPGRGTGRRT